MAIINDGFGANSNGGIGGIYFRKQNGKTVMCSKPAFFNKPMDEASVMRRNLMQCIMNFSKVITKDIYFYPAWKKSPLKGISGYHKSNGFNHPGKSKPFNAENLKLLPGTPGITVQVKEALYADKKFTVTLHPLGNDCGINFQRENFISAGAFVMLSKGPAETLDNNKTLPLSRATVALSPAGELKFELTAPVQDIDLFAEYPNYTVYVLFTTLNSEEQPVKHSDTFVYRY